MPGGSHVERADTRPLLGKKGIAITSTGAAQRQSQISLGQKASNEHSSWATSNQVNYGMENQRVTPQDRSAFAGRATGIKNAQTSGEDIAPHSGGKRTVARPEGPGLYNPIQGSFTRLNPSSMKQGQQDRSLSRDVTPDRLGAGSMTEKNYKSYRNDYTNLLKGSQSVSNVNQPQHKVYDPATQETSVPILELNKA